VVLGVSFFVVFVAVWAAVTFGGLVPKIFLADPLQMLRSGWVLRCLDDALSGTRYPLDLVADIRVER
jgi:NitT/TauT family transport system permease protein